MTSSTATKFANWLLVLLTIVGAAILVISVVMAEGAAVDRLVFGPQSPSQPVFKPTVRWGGVGNATLDADPVTAEITLLPNGRAQLVKFPQGTSVSNQQGYVCFERIGSKLFTGRAAWTGSSAFGFQLKFGRSSVQVRSDTDGYIGRTPDWDAVELDECGTSAPEWILGYGCGSAGGGDAGDLDAVCPE